MSAPNSIRHAQHPSCVLVLRSGVNARCFLCGNVCCNARYACRCNVNIHPQCALARAGQVNVVQPGAQRQRRVHPAVNNSRGGYVNGYAYNNNGNQGGYMTNNRQVGGYGNGYAGNNNGYQQGGYGNQYVDAGQQMGGYGGGGGGDGGGFIEDVVDFVCEEGAWMAVDAVSTATIGAPISEFVRY